MPDLTKKDDGSATDLAQNYRKTRESTNFGTRKLAFYTFLAAGESDLVGGKDDNNGIYFQVVQALQEAGAEIYWLGEPHDLGESFYNNWDFLNFYDEGNLGNLQGFMFAIPDDASNPITFRACFNNDPPVYSEATAVITNDYDPNWISFDGSFEHNPYVGMPIVFSGDVFGGIEAGKTYYIREWDTDGPNLQIKISATVDNEVLDIQFPSKFGGEPGPVFELTNGSGSMTARLYWLDAAWAGTAGDYAPGCCADMTYPAALALNLQGHVFEIIGPGPWWIERCMPSFGIFPAWWAN
jgi:hypothetical protein